MAMFKTYLYIFIKSIIRLCTRLMFIFPIKKNRIFFEAFQGRNYSCNPKYVFESIKDDKSLEIIWSLRDINKINAKDNVKVVKYRSLKWLYYQTTAAVIVNNATPTIAIPKRKGQTFIETWHGGGAYKTSNSKAVIVSKYSNIRVKWNRNKINEKIDYYLSSSELFSRYKIREGDGYQGEIIQSGMPRNDIFFDSNTVSLINNKVRRHYKIDDNDMVILYAPTWRGTNLNDTRKVEIFIDFDNIVQSIMKAQNKEVTILFRKHYADKHDYGNNEKVIDVSDYPDMQELLCASDMLITDYSSTMWDYALLNRPCFLFVTDYEEYAFSEQGLFTPIETWPGIICEDNKALADNINSINRDAYEQKIANYLERSGNYERGNARDIVAKLIKESLPKTL